MLHNNDHYLINYEADEPVKNDEHVSELSISHKLSHYLELFVTEYHVDCEYNRNVADKKSMGESRIRPDIIIHKRGNNEKNFVVIEIKPWWNRDDVIKDEDKLAYLTNQMCIRDSKKSIHSTVNEIHQGHRATHHQYS